MLVHQNSTYNFGPNGLIFRSNTQNMVAIQEKKFRPPLRKLPNDRIFDQSQEVQSREAIWKGGGWYPNSCVQSDPGHPIWVKYDSRIYWGNGRSRTWPKRTLWADHKDTGFIHSGLGRDRKRCWSTKIALTIVDQMGSFGPKLNVLFSWPSIVSYLYPTQYG